MQDAGDKGDGLSIEDDVTNTTGAVALAPHCRFKLAMANSCTMCLHTLT